MIANSQLSTMEPKKLKQKEKQLIKTVEQEQNHRKGDHVEGYQWGVGGGMGKKGTGNKKHNW